WPVRAAADRGQTLANRAVTVPRLTTEEDLHEPHAPLDESPGDQAARAIFARRILVESVEAENVSRLGRDVERLFRSRLHGRSQLVAANPRFELGLAGMRFEMTAIQSAEESEALPLSRPLLVRRWVEVQNPRLMRAENGPLVERGHEAAGPVDRAV